MLDVDGPLIPGRMYYAKHGHYDQENGVFLYDPVAVGMLREICRQTNAKIVYNTAHNEENFERMRYKARINNLEDLLHDDCRTNFCITKETRLGGINEWLSRHSEVESWTVIDDENIFDGPPQVKINFDIGMTIGNFFEVIEILTGKKQSGLIVL